MRWPMRWPIGRGHPPVFPRRRSLPPRTEIRLPNSACLCSLHALNGSHEIDESVALEVSFAAQARGGIDEDLLDALWIQYEFTPYRQEGGDGAGNVGGRHARSALIDVGGD